MEGTIWHSNVQDLFASELQLALIKAGSNPLFQLSLITMMDQHGIGMSRICLPVRAKIMRKNCHLDACHCRHYIKKVPNLLLLHERTPVILRVLCWNRFY